MLRPRSGFWVCAAVMAVLATSAGAEQPEDEGDGASPLAAEIDLKLAATRGNTDVASGDFKLIVARQFEDWRFSFLTEAIGSTNDDEVIAESVLIDAMAARRFNGRLGLVVEADGYKNRFAGIDWRTTLGAGLAWEATTDSRWDIHTMAGLGWQHEIPTEPEVDSNSYAIGVAQVRGVLKISDNTSFRQVLYFAPEIEAFDQYLLYMKLTWRTRTNSWLSVAIDYVVRHDSDPAFAAESTDHSLQAGFVFSFGKSAAKVIDDLLLPPG